MKTFHAIIPLGPAAGARLMAFLMGPPNLGRGKSFHRGPRRRRGGDGAADTSASIIMDPMMSDLNPYTFSMPAVPLPALNADNSDPGEVAPRFCRTFSGSMAEGPARCIVKHRWRSGWRLQVAKRVSYECPLSSAPHL